MFSPGLGKDRPQHGRITVHSGESSDTIKAGTPCALIMSGTEDGILVESVVNATSAALGTQLLMGVVTQDIPAGEYGESVIWGYMENLVAVRSITRAASTDSFATQAAIAVGDQLVLETLTGGFSRAAAAATGALVNVIALETLASVAGAASTTSNTSLVSTSTTKIKAYVRLM